MAKLDLLMNRDCWRCSGTGNNLDVKDKLIPGVCRYCYGWGTQLGEDGEDLRHFLLERFGIEMKTKEPYHKVRIPKPTEER